MVAKIAASVVTVLALSAGAAYAATQLASSDGTQVCVNQTNGLLRAASECRDSEYPMTIGGGSDAVVTSSGVFSVDAGQTSGRTLPLTGITVSGVCAFVPAGTGSPPALQDMVAARARLDAASGSSLEMVPDFTGVASYAPAQPLGGAGATFHGGGWQTWIASSRGATATIVVSAAGTWSPQKCTYLWQATEVPN